MLVNVFEYASYYRYLKLSKKSKRKVKDNYSDSGKTSKQAEVAELDTSGATSLAVLLRRL